MEKLWETVVRYIIGAIVIFLVIMVAFKLLLDFIAANWLPFLLAVIAIFAVRIIYNRRQW